MIGLSLGKSGSPSPGSRLTDRLLCAIANIQSIPLRHRTGEREKRVE